MYIIGDVHGCYETLCRLLDKLPNWREHGVILAGDMCDRGPYSRQVYERLIADPDIQAVKGNHDDFFGRSFFGPEKRRAGTYKLWNHPSNGGWNTMQSYTGKDKLLLEHAAYANDLPLFLEFPDIIAYDNNWRHLVVSHNVMSKQYNVRNKLVTDSMKRMFEGQLLWADLFKIKDIPKIYNVTGHMFGGPPRGRNSGKQNPYEPRIRSFYAMIDTGAGCDDNGYLTALKFPEMEVYREKTNEKFIPRPEEMSILYPVLR